MQLMVIWNWDGKTWRKLYIQLQVKCFRSSTENIRPGLTSMIICLWLRREARRGKCNTRSERKTFRKVQRSLQRYTREMKSRWRGEKARELHEAAQADRRDMKAFYTGLRKTYGPKPRGLVQLWDLTGTTVLQVKDKILEDLFTTLTSCWIYQET